MPRPGAALQLAGAAHHRHRRGGCLEIRGGSFQQLQGCLCQLADRGVLALVQRRGGDDLEGRS
jgi:hypothetical protein